jgi:hypothetical protein
VAGAVAFAVGILAALVYTLLTRGAEWSDGALIFIQAAGVIALGDLIWFLLKPNVRQSPLLRGRHTTLVIGTGLLLAIAIIRLIKAFFP